MLWQKRYGDLTCFLAILPFAVVGCVWLVSDSKVLANQQPAQRDEVVEQLIAILSQYNGTEFHIESRVVDSAVAASDKITKYKGVLSVDGSEAIIEKSYTNKGKRNNFAYYFNNDYAYVVDCTPTNVFYALGSTKPNIKRNPINEVGLPLIFFFGRTRSGKSLSEFFRESKPEVTILPSADDSRQYAITVASTTEGAYRFEVGEYEKSFQLRSVSVEETPESISAKNGHPVAEVAGVVRKKRLYFKDIVIKNGKVSSVILDGIQNELPDGNVETIAHRVSVSVTDSRPLTQDIVRSTKMFSVFEMPQQISATMICDSLAPHAIVNGSLVRLDVQYDAELSAEPTPLRKTWLQKYWIVVSCVALVAAAILGMIAYRRVKCAD